MIGKISSADYRVNFGSGVKPAAKYKEQLASVIKKGYDEAASNPDQRLNLLRAWEKLLKWEHKPLEFNLLALFKEALKNGRLRTSFGLNTNFFTSQDYAPRKDVLENVQSELNKDDNLYITGLLRKDSSRELIVPAEYANGRSIQYNTQPGYLNNYALNDDEHYVFTDSIKQDERELQDAIMDNLIRESWEKTADELWEKYGTEINEAAKKFDSSAIEVK